MSTATPDQTIRIRRADTGDLPSLGRLGGMLVRAHHQFDQQRFLTPEEDVDDGYAWFLGTQLAEPDVAIFVAERTAAPPTIVGYTYVGIEPLSWKELRPPAGFIHDVVVDPSIRGEGIGVRLIQAGIAWLEERGSPRTMLWTAQNNPGAQRLFERLGFRRTMIEMTRESPDRQ